MWVTQTYLGTVEPDARVFVYYFFENKALRLNGGKRRGGIFALIVVFPII